MMSSFQGDRLLSASEVERWSYCPLSWELERKGSRSDPTNLALGSKRHGDIGRKARSVKTAQKSSRQNTLITWTFLTFSALLLLMGISLIVVDRSQFIDIDVWKAGVLVLSLLMISVSIMYYFYSRESRRKGPLDALRKLLKSIDSSNWKRSNNPLLFYFSGLLLLFNAVVLLRPFGINLEMVAGIMAFSLILTYIVILVMFTLYFRLRRSDPEGGGPMIGGPLILMLLISISVLFIFISDRVDPRGNMGWVFMFISLLWFMGAIVSDILTRFRSSEKKRDIGDRRGLLIVTMALMASVFTASTFLAKGDNLDEYYPASVAMSAAWLLGGVFFFWRGMHQKRIARNGLDSLSLPKEAELVSYDDPDLRKGSKPLTSKKHFLVGTPDLVIEEDGFRIPVEVKTGRIPPRPHFSHVMQLSAYMILTDVNFRQQTPYGYVDYTCGKGKAKRHKIEWDLMTKAIVLSKVSEIREAERTGEVHRNHEREGKCRNCSRREDCPERLV
ncbi:MAG: PD-(D/E)XK nuclease family protein [Thermoplasmatota archaeon]